MSSSNKLNIGHSHGSIVFSRPGQSQGGYKEDFYPVGEAPGGVWGDQLSSIPCVSA